MNLEIGPNSTSKHGKYIFVLNSAMMQEQSC